MAKKGKEPAGLRKWRLAQKAKKTKRASSPKKTRKVKTMASRRSYGRKRTSRKKFSTWKMAKGVLYTGAVALPMYTGYQQLGGGSVGAQGVVKAACFVDPATNQFSFAHGAQIWTPVAVLAAVDFITSKVPIQAKIRNGVNSILG